MSDEESESGGPSLELPSLGFGRKRRKTAGEPVIEEPDADADASTDDSTPDTGDGACGDTDADPGVLEPAAPPLFVDEVSTTPPAAPPARRAARSLPAIGDLAAAVLTGLLVGLATVVLTFASLNLCEVARGTSSCGGSGLFLLVAILVAMTLVGAVLLRLFGVSDPGSTSFLAVGLMAVLVLLFLVDVIFNWWMVIVVPVFAMATFALSHWVTTAFIEPADH